MKIVDVLNSQPLALDTLGLLSREKAVALTCIIDAGYKMYKENRPRFITMYGTYMTEILDEIDKGE